MTEVPAGADEDEVVVRATVSRLVITTQAPVEIVEPMVRDELERRGATARIQTFVPILTERAARHRLRDRSHHSDQVMRSIARRVFSSAHARSTPSHDE